MVRVVSYPDRMIRYRPKKELIERIPFALLLPPATIRKSEELQELFCALTGEKREIRLDELKMLLHAADDNLDWLLARMRQMKKDGNRTNNIYRLAGTVKQLYWIRPLPESPPKPDKKPAVKTPQSHPEKKLKTAKPKESPPASTRTEQIGKTGHHKKSSHLLPEPRSVPPPTATPPVTPS